MGTQTNEAKNIFLHFKDDKMPKEQLGTKFKTLKFMLFLRITEFYKTLFIKYR